MLSQTAVGYWNQLIAKCSVQITEEGTQKCVLDLASLLLLYRTLEEQYGVSSLNT